MIIAPCSAEAPGAQVKRDFSFGFFFMVRRGGVFSIFFPSSSFGEIAGFIAVL